MCKFSLAGGVYNALVVFDAIVESNRLLKRAKNESCKVGRDGADDEGGGDGNGS